MNYIELTVAMGVLASVFALCWRLEVRSSGKLRERHSTAWTERERMQAVVITALREEHANELTRVRHEAWKEGVKMGAEARRQMRYGQHDKLGRF